MLTAAENSDWMLNTDVTVCHAFDWMVRYDVISFLVFRWLITITSLLPARDWLSRYDVIYLPLVRTRTENIYFRTRTTVTNLLIQ